MKERKRKQRQYEQEARQRILERISQQPRRLLRIRKNP